MKDGGRCRGVLWLGWGVCGLEHGQNSHAPGTPKALPNRNGQPVIVMCRQSGGFSVPRARGQSDGTRRFARDAEPRYRQSEFISPARAPGGQFFQGGKNLSRSMNMAPGTQPT